MSLGKRIGLSILNMGVQRVLDFVSIVVVTTVVVRSLSREEYGMLSLVLGYGLFFNVLNISVSSILIRDYPKLKGGIDRYMQAFFLFSLIKCAGILLVSAAIGVFLYRTYGSVPVIFVLGLSSATAMMLFLSEPFTVLLSVDFRQVVLTKIALVCAAVNIVLSLGAIWLPTALFVSAKNAMVALVGLGLTVGYAVRAFTLRPACRTEGYARLIRECLVGFSLWSHLAGVMTDIIYRADLLILGWLNAPFRTVGNYNIALQMANLTKLLPQILQYNASLGLSHSENARRQEEITFLFVKYSFLVSVATMVTYILFGRLAIRIVAGSDVEAIYGLGLYIIAGLCLFNTFRPLISYGIVVHDVRECLVYAIAPSCIVTLACYVVMGKLWEANGLALANLVGGIAMTFFTLSYVHMRTAFRWRFALLTDTERELLARVRAKLSA